MLKEASVRSSSVIFASREQDDKKAKIKADDGGKLNVL